MNTELLLFSSGHCGFDKILEFNPFSWYKDDPLTSSIFVHLFVFDKHIFIITKRGS